MASDTLLADIRHEFRRHKDLADRALAAVEGAAFYARTADAVNPLAVIVKHMAGNLASRWSDFLASDGEKPTRDRDAEFVVTETDSRAALMDAWERGWGVLFDTLAAVTDADLDRTVTIRGEPHTARQALLRGLTHAAYHVGQITYLSRQMNSEAPWLTIAPGASRAHEAGYREPPGA